MMAKRREQSIEQNLNELVNYALDHGLIEIQDIEFVANQLLDLLQIGKFEYERVNFSKSIDEILKPILSYAVRKKIITNDTTDERDLFDAKIMGMLSPRPSEVNRKFDDLYQINPKKATDYFYQLSKAVNYIRTERIKKDQQFQVQTDYGIFDITINLSKPEKDPQTIAFAKAQPSSGYPKCVLCKENVGYAGHLSHPARQNHRIIPVTLSDEQWYLQYSPYVYYNEHCIVLKNEHEPMIISAKTFQRLFDFVKQFKHYFVGANADLPIVGGSILSHDHFQGGAHTFTMDNAAVICEFEVPNFADIKVELLKWPLTTLRLKGKLTDRLVELGNIILLTWRGYSDESLEIQAKTAGTQHNTITPITRYRDGHFELDLVLRNNRTAAKHPDGIFHPHEQYHHLKKENIGLIEVMGLAVLPGRLSQEITVLIEALVKDDVTLLEDAGLKKHSAWYFELAGRRKELPANQIEELVQESIGLKFVEILECCGVYKLDEAGLAGVRRFMEVVIDSKILLKT